MALTSRGQQRLSDYSTTLLVAEMYALKGSLAKKVSKSGRQPLPARFRRSGLPDMPLESFEGSCFHTSGPFRGSIPAFWDA